MSTINLNDPVWVRLTPEAVEHLRRRHDELRAEVPSLGTFVPPATDAEGWSRHQLWVLFEDFGSQIHLGCRLPFQSAQIRTTDPAEDLASEGWTG